MAATRDATADAEARIAALEAQLAAERAARATEQAALAALTIEHDHLRLAYQNLQHELALLRRRLFAAKAERLDTAQLELEFATKLRELDDLNRRLGAPPPEPPAANGGDQRTRRAATKPTGRRDLRLLDLPEERIELIDPVLEGTATRIDWEESCKLSWRRAGGGEDGCQTTPRDMSSARSSIMSSWPPTVLRRPSSTRMSRELTPYFFAARCANSRNEE